MSKWYVTYKNTDILHFNPNHDPSNGQFAPKSFAKHRAKADYILSKDLPTTGDRKTIKKQSANYNRQMMSVISKAAKKGDREYVEKLTRKMAPYYNEEEVQAYTDQLTKANKKGFVAGLMGGIVGGTAAAVAEGIKAANRDKKAKAREGLEYLKVNTDIYNMKMNELYKEKYGKKETNR